LLVCAEKHKAEEKVSIVLVIELSWLLNWLWPDLLFRVSLFDILCILASKQLKVLIINCYFLVSNGKALFIICYHLYSVLRMSSAIINR